MENYIKQIYENNVVFNDLINKKELSVSRRNGNIFDALYIDENFDIKFVEYIVNELKKTNDLSVVFVLYDSIKLDNILYNRGFRISNYQYIIESKNYSAINNYGISSNLDGEGKKFYLNVINKIDKLNCDYQNNKFINIDDTWFNNEEFTYRIYRKDGKIVGIVDYRVIENDDNYDNAKNDMFNYNNKLCTRFIFSEEKDILEDMIKDLINTYKKDIIINITYSEKNLREVSKMMYGKFNYCRYILEDNYNSMEI